MTRCDICLILSDDSDKYYYKWSDAGEHGRDMDGFCCGDCAHMPPEEQIRLMMDMKSAKLARTEGLYEAS